MTATNPDEGKITHWHFEHDGAGRISAIFGVVQAEYPPATVTFSIPHHCVIGIIRALTNAAIDVEVWNEGEDRVLNFNPIDHHED